MGTLEITDLLWQADGAGHRVPVVQSEVVSMLADLGQRRAARIVARMPSDASGALDPRYVDDLMLRVHDELQRLSAELRLARRVAGLLGPLVARVRAAAGDGTVRVVDVGCGLGYVVRWLAATSALGAPVDLVGVDLNGTLVDAASRLAARDGLRCQFVQADAFAPGAVIEDGPRTVVISSGLLHHVPAAQLSGFFSAQAGQGVAAFAHWDILPSPWSTLGAWVLLRARMREQVTRHDGILSARRAYPASVLLAAARAGAPEYESAVMEKSRWQWRVLDALRPIVGMSAATTCAPPAESGPLAGSGPPAESGRLAGSGRLAAELARDMERVRSVK